MFRLVVLSAFVALATAAPGGYLHAVPVATSHQERLDIIESSPVLKEVITPVHIIPDHTEEDVHDLHDLHHLQEIHSTFAEDIAPVIDTIVFSAPEVIKTVSTHQEVHQVHDSPVHNLETVVVDAPEIHDIPVVFAEEDNEVHNPVVSVESHDEVHHVVHPVHSVVVDHHVINSDDVHQVYHVQDTPISQLYPEVLSAIPVVLNHEEVHQVNELPVLSVVKAIPTAFSHTSRTDVHQKSVVVPEVHVW